MDGGAVDAYTISLMVNSPEADCSVGTSSVFITLYMNPFMSHLVSEQKGD